MVLFAFGLVMAALSEMSDVLERVLPVTIYLTLPLTGVFTMQGWLTAKARHVLAWSALVNIMEMFRAGMFSQDVVTIFDLQYIVWFCFALTFAGLRLRAETGEHGLIREPRWLRLQTFGGLGAAGELTTNLLPLLCAKRAGAGGVVR